MTKNVNETTNYRYFAVYKPFQVLCQFTPESGNKCLKDIFDLPKDVYPVGRLDYDSEGLLIITNDNYLIKNVLEPEYAHRRTYLVQVEGTINNEAISKLQNGIEISINGKIYKTKSAAEVKHIEAPQLPERVPPIRFRKSVPDTWISLTLTEGKNRQVRKMTAAAGFPTLRLVRYSIEGINIYKMNPGDVIEYSKEEIYKLLRIN